MVSPGYRRRLSGARRSPAACSSRACRASCRGVRHCLLAAVVASGVTLVLIGLVPRFPVAVGLLVVWGLLFATVTPVRQAYLNELIPSEQRATGLSFDSWRGAAGGVVVQPLLGKAADVWGYPASYLCGATIQLKASPFIWLVRRERPDL